MWRAISWLRNFCKMSASESTAAQLEQAIAALEAQRATLGDAVVATALAALREQLAALTSPVEPPEQRRHVTVLFADISGFTALAERLDAEEVQALLAELWACLDQVLLAHGGTLDKHIGDAVLAVWGLAQAREDDAEQAARAALALQQALADFRATARTETGGAVPVQVQMRVGLNTGLVSVATVASTGERNLIGDTVNLASRLQTAAPPDGILISQTTYDAVRGLFNVTVQPPLTIKGKREPVTAYMLHSAKLRAFHMRTRGLAGIVTQTIGREAELAALQAAYQRTVAGQGVQWLTLVGDAGVGKSRLLREYMQWLELRPERIWLFTARAWPHTQHSPYFLLRDLLAFRFEIADSASQEEARMRLTVGFSETFGPEMGAEAAAFMGQLIGLDFRHSPWITHIADNAQQIYGRAAVLFREYWQRLCLAPARPTVLLLEDLHWADRESLALFATTFAALQAASATPPLALCVIGATRPELWEQATFWGQDALAHERLTLTPLSTTAARALVQELLQRLAVVPEWLSTLLVEGGAGNPYFIEELVQWLIEQGVLRPGAEVWEVAEERAVGLSVPGTVQGVLQARLERVRPAERVTLQHAAVVGRAFWRGAVEYIAQEPTPEACWADLQQRELVFRQPTSQLRGEEEYHFKHALLRDVVYEYTLKRQRRVYHRRAAEWLMQVANERVDEWAAVIAAHYEAAGEQLAAAHWYQRAGKQAQGAYASQLACAYYRKALEFFPVGSEYARSRAECCEGVAQELFEQVQYVEAEHYCQEMYHTAETIGDLSLQARARCLQADLQARMGRLDEAQTSAEQAETLARAGGVSIDLARALHQRGWIAYHYGDTATALALGQQALEISTQLDLRREMMRAMNVMGVAYFVQGQYRQAGDVFSQVLDLCRELADRRAVGTVLNNFGATLLFRGDYATAAPLFEEAGHALREVGVRRNVQLSQSNLGYAWVGLGRYQEAVTLLQSVLAEYGDELYEAANTYCFLAQAYLGLEQWPAAREAALRSLEMAQSMGAQDAIGRAWRVLGKIVAMQGALLEIGGEVYDPAACFAASLEIFTAKKAEGERARTLLAWGRYARAVGDAERGEAMQQEGQAIFDRLGIVRE